MVMSLLEGMQPCGQLCTGGAAQASTLLERLFNGENMHRRLLTACACSQNYALTSGKRTWAIVVFNQARAWRFPPFVCVYRTVFVVCPPGAAQAIALHTCKASACQRRCDSGTSAVI